MTRFLRCLILALIVLLIVAGLGPAEEGRFPLKRRDLPKAILATSMTFDPVKARRGQTITWKLQLQLAPGWHTYPTQIQAEQAKGSETAIGFPSAGDVVFVGKLKEPLVELKNEEGIGFVEEAFGDVTWERSAVVSPQAKPGETTVKVPVTVTVCNERGCLPQATIEFHVCLTISDEPPIPIDAKYLKEVSAGGSLTPSTSPDPKSVGVRGASPPATAAQASAAPARSEDGLLAFILSGIFWGAISLLTPCVFPMIPITVSFFLKQSEKEHYRPLAMAVVYSATIVIVLTIGAVLLLSVFQAASQHWATNLILGTLFVFFALSLFGMYEITLPSGLANYTSTQQGRGGMVGTVFMALTFSIISFSCVAPFMGGFAALVPSFGNVAAMFKAGSYGQLFQIFGKLLLGALAFSVTFASPFFFLALFPSMLRKLPKSGSWMNTVKVVMGFLEVAAAIKFLRACELLAFGQAHFLTYDLALGMYIALSVACGVYLLGLFRLPHDEPPEHLGVPRMVVSILFLSLAIYLTPALFKVSADQKQRPNGTVFAWLDSFLLPDLQERRLGSLAEGLKEARDKRKLVFIDFTGIS
jgi:thiol:disulfide interchange protein